MANLAQSMLAEADHAAAVMFPVYTTSLPFNRTVSISKIRGRQTKRLE